VNLPGLSPSLLASSRWLARRLLCVVGVCALYLATLVVLSGSDSERIEALGTRLFEFPLGYLVLFGGLLWPGIYRQETFAAFLVLAGLMWGLVIVVAYELLRLAMRIGGGFSRGQPDDPAL
jgi:hypothetical protein